MGLRLTIETEKGFKGEYILPVLPFSEKESIDFLEELLEYHGGTLHIEKSEGQLE